MTALEPQTELKNLLTADFSAFADLIAVHAETQPDQIAIVDGEARWSWARLNDYAERISASLQSRGVGPGDKVALLGVNSAELTSVMIAALRTGAGLAMITGSATTPQITGMIEDSGASILFIDRAQGDALGARLPEVERVSLDDSSVGMALTEWMAAPGIKSDPVDIDPASTFNVIYSSGTTGVPKGIVHTHQMRWRQVSSFAELCNEATITMVSTPLYSNTTLACFLPTLAAGGRIILMRKFKTGEFLKLSQDEKVNLAMLVPVQYQRLLADPYFDSFDLSSYAFKFCTSAPFPAAVKADALKRWPGELIEFYGMTEGGCTFMLDCRAHPDKLHTVGRAAPGHEAKIIDEEGQELGPGEVGEVVGRSSTMMEGYLNRPGETDKMIWADPDGGVFYRHGDIGKLDADGFLTLVDRKKDMIISGGFNIYAIDLEATLLQDPRIEEAAVIGAPSEKWGETPVGFVVAAEDTDLQGVLDNTNAKLGKTQRLDRLIRIDTLPRNGIGKVLKRQLRERLPD